MFHHLTASDIAALVTVGTFVLSAVTGALLLIPRLRRIRAEHIKFEADADAVALTSAAGAIDSAARSLKIMLDAVPGSNTMPQHEIAAVVDATAQAMLAILNTLPGRMMRSENELAEIKTELEDIRTQLRGLSRRPMP